MKTKLFKGQLLVLCNGLLPRCAEAPRKAGKFVETNASATLLKLAQIQFSMIFFQEKIFTFLTALVRIQKAHKKFQADQTLISIEKNNPKLVGTMCSLRCIHCEV